MNYPKHIAIIPDGNRTRAKENKKTSFQGHQEWYNRAIELAEYLIKNTSVNILTYWWLSTENTLKRGDDELEWLYVLFQLVTERLRKTLKENRINLRWIGKSEHLPEDLVSFFQKTENEFNYWSEKYLCIAINYGWRDEIIRWIKSRSETNGNIGELTEESFSEHLDFSGLPAVDLVIRTKGKKASRISWFMLWRIGYAELFFSPLYFPDFSTEKLDEALERFHERVEYRNFGK